MSIQNLDQFSSSRRNYILNTHRRDGLIEWMKEMLNHSFVLDAKDSYNDTFTFFEELIDEYRKSIDPINCRLKLFVPTVSEFHSNLPLREAFKLYDAKYSVSLRRHISPSFNEIRHILNLSQVMAIGNTLKLISFDGDQTLYSDGGNFEKNENLAGSIRALLKAGVKVALITAAGYGLDGSKYAVRLTVLLNSFLSSNLTSEEISRFYVFGGECNYLLQCQLNSDNKKISLIPVADDIWQANNLNCQKPLYWNSVEIKQILDVVESCMNTSVDEMHLRVKILRKPRAVGMIPGGDDVFGKFTEGHGHKKIKKEALDEVVLRCMDALKSADPPIQIPYCVFNGGRDAWVDIGNKKVGVEVLQAVFGLSPSNCLHVGDQFLHTGNDFAAREICPCIWITSPLETEKILEHILRNMNIAYERLSDELKRLDITTNDSKISFNAYTGGI
jgi:IMP and pyridine-specific 5'-nucleotidase